MSRAGPVNGGRFVVVERQRGLAADAPVRHRPVSAPRPLRRGLRNSSIRAGEIFAAAPEQEEVAVGAHPQLAVGHDAVVLEGRGGRHQGILLAVDDEDAALPAHSRMPRSGRWSVS